MVGWIVIGVISVVFFSVLGAMWHEFRRPFSATDQWCSDVDEALDAQYGGWRNLR